MKQKLLLTLSLMIVFVLPFFPLPAEAVTSFGMYPVKVNVKEGQTFSLTVKVNPNGQKNYTVKASIKFPADLVSVKTWQYANDWMPLRKGGYDSFSNTDGTIIRTAGYPDGFEGLINFGTATFWAKKSGAGIIEFSGENLALDENNVNQYTVSNQVSLTVTSAVTPQQTPPVSTPVQQPQETPPAPAQQPQPTPTAQPEQPIEPSQQAPEQLFDINLQLDQAKVSKISDLQARVLFNSFGNVPTAVDMTFDILDNNDNVVYSETGAATVQTEGVYNKIFSDFAVAPGDYTLRLTTLYNGNVRDEFRQAFQVNGPIAPFGTGSIIVSIMQAGIAVWIIFILIIAAVTYIIYLIIKRKK